MKLYTKEQVSEALNAGFRLAMEKDGGLNEYRELFINALTPIELPSDEEIWRWWKTQKFQREQGEQEYTLLYEIDLPKILKAFTEYLIQGDNK